MCKTVSNYISYVLFVFLKIYCEIFVNMINKNISKTYERLELFSCNLGFQVKNLGQGGRSSVHHELLDVVVVCLFFVRSFVLHKC